jgi:hypothetical protein
MLERRQIDIRGIARMRERGDLIKTFGDSKAGGRMVRGVASTPTLDSRGRRIWPAGISATLPCPLLYEHDGGEEIGQVVYLEIYSEYVVMTATMKYSGRADGIWRSLEKGHLALSIGHENLLAVDSCDAISITKWRLREISVVGEPANEDTWLARYRPPVKLQGHRR